MKQCKFCTDTEDVIIKSGRILVKGTLDSYICSKCAGHIVNYSLGYYAGSAIKVKEAVRKHLDESFDELK